jgi:rod shape determining protein RodA
MKSIKKISVDWWVISAVVVLMAFGAITMGSLGSHNGYLLKQVIWGTVALTVLMVTSTIDMSFLKRPWMMFGLYVVANGVLCLVILLGSTVKGATSWFQLGGISFQPSDLVKIVLILILAKYLSRRHIEIANLRHLLVTGAYAFIPFFLVFLQPDFGSAVIFGVIWFGMMMVSGLSKKHLLILTATGLIVGSILWGFVFKPYQKARIMNFLNPLADVRGTGYNAYQSMIAVGSGQVIGKGLGFGTQSRLNFLPEYQTDFIFAAFAEEWGFIGSLIIIGCYLIIIWRILRLAHQGTTNFETLYAVGLVIYFASHVIINMGMNIGILPVTGITLPFMSYGGSHLIAECLSLGILFSLLRNRRTVHRDDIRHEFLGLS